MKVSEEFQKGSFESTLIGDLLTALNNQAVNYCHWKSNRQIDLWLDGEGDLDLLVSRKDIGKFTAIIGDLGFKKALPPPEKDFPSVVNYYGYDRTKQRFVHIHAYYQLILGHDFTENYRLPIEEALLADTVRYKKIYLPIPEMELIVSIVRRVLQYSATEHFGRFLFGNVQKRRQKIDREIGYLESQIDQSKLLLILRRDFPMLGEDLFKDCLESLENNASVWQKISVKRKLEKSLSPYACKSRLSETVTRFQRSVFAVYKKLFGIRKKRKRLESGGALIAIVGGDGAGKTTAVNDIHGWLSQIFETRKVHLGKPSKSALTLLAGAGLKVSRKILGNHSTNSFFQHLRWLGTARDRYKLYKNIRCYAANGEIVICDRYPIPDLHLMDGPKIAASFGPEELEGRSKFLSRIENWYYRQFIPPDALFVLRVKPQTAVERKTDESPEHVFTRSEELWNFDWRNTEANLVDASRPLEDVSADLRSRIWKLL